MTDTTSARTSASGQRLRPTRSPRLIVVCLSLGNLAFAVLQSLVAPALATIGQAMNASTGEVSWVLTAYLLSASVSTPVLGRLGDMVGKRKVLIAVLSVLLVGTVAAALAPNLGVLVAARAVQGAAGALMPLSIGIVRDELPRERVSVTIGLLSAIFGVGAGIGIVAAGPIVEILDWHWLFWLPCALIVAALLGVVLATSESSLRSPGRLDLPGAGILAVSLVSLLLVVTYGRSWGWGSAWTLGLIALGAAALIAFVLVEMRVGEPLIDMRLIVVRGAWTAHVVALVIGFASFSMFVLVPSLLQLPSDLGYGFDATVTEAGLFLLPAVVAMVVLGPVAGVLVRALGPKPPMLIGSALVTAAFVIPAITHAEVWHILVSGAAAGAGIGLGLAAAAMAVVEASPVAQTGEAVSTNTIARTIGSSIGTAVVATILTANSTSAAGPADSGFTLGFWVSAAVTAIAVISSLAAPAAARRSRSPMT